ncbi:MAG: hypothetical protein IPO60_16190 [Flavobacteriales bacterium]|jgi:hypothetical protein|nr:hypothetical protein [Flavobacteriales bacterium]MBK7249172.1 hypothetical protein [Flavobacteriales bacterium]MBK9058593.1 hypothetical protein [Flavobacteriales bacterium]MBK9599802.1 hypothetical protein [Flavobacteriales bacterium]QQS71398.1 MAG: hypothetical protein IPP95_09350 [Flavobacteriales bacterium]
MKKGSFALPVLIIALLASATVHAQSAPGLSAYQFSDGVHPTFDATFEDARERDVASFWRNELKSISVKVTNKKELIGAAARIPAASPDTMRILIAVDRPKGGLYTTAHIAFLSTAGYVGPDTPERELNGCTQWVQQRTLTLLKQFAQAALDLGRRDLSRLQRDLDMLKREKDRAETNVRKAQQRSEKAGRDKENSERQLGEMDASMPTAPADSTSDPNVEKNRLKQQAKLHDKAARAAKTAEDMEKKTKDLEWAIKQNDKDQVSKQEEIDRQQTVVNGLQEKLQAIH